MWKFVTILQRQASFNLGVADSFPGNGASFKFKQKVTGTAGAGSTKNVKIVVTQKHLSNFWRVVEMPLIVKLILSYFGL